MGLISAPQTMHLEDAYSLAVFLQSAWPDTHSRTAPSLEKIPTKVILDGLKRNMSRGNSLSDELDLSSVLGDTRAYLYSPVLG